jgi:chemotaxis protein MotB
MAARGGKKIIIVKKKVAGGGGHHGGSWKVAYADFVTAMMAFFMVMWILGMDESTKQAIEGYFANPVGYKKGYGSGSSPLATGTTMSTITKTPLRVMSRSTEQRTFEELRKKILDKVSENDSLKKLNAVVDVQVTPDGLRIELVESESGDLYFPLGSAKMNVATALILELVGEELAKLQPAVILEGHTDAAKFGRDASYTNWELSTDRANASRRVLLAAGLQPDRIREVRGYADTRPRVPSDVTAPANRRISILLPYSDMPSSPAERQEMAASKRDSMVESLQNPMRRNY